MPQPDDEFGSGIFVKVDPVHLLRSLVSYSRHELGLNDLAAREGSPI